MGKVREKVRTQGVRHHPMLVSFELFEALKYYHALRETLKEADKVPGRFSKTQIIGMAMGVHAIESVAVGTWPEIRDRLDFEVEYQNWKEIHGIED